VLATGEPHELPRQRYDVPDPTVPGQFVERYWRPRNSAVLDEQGQVVYLIHSVVDITSQEQAEARAHASQKREQAALAEAQRQRGELERIFEQAPVAIAVYRGPENIIELANPLVCELWGRRAQDIIGLSLFEALPEVAGMGYEELLAGVLATGEPHVAHEMPAQHDRNGHRETVYWNFVYLPVREADGRVSGVMVVANEVTEQVAARQQVQHLNQQLEVLNQALHASNEELLANQEEVLLVQQHLEARVQERTQQLQAALHEAEQQRTLVASQQEQLNQVLGQVQDRELVYQLIAHTPAAVAILRGPALRYEYVNAAYQAFFPGRGLVGCPVAEALPETSATSVLARLEQVYRTGETYFGPAMAVQVAQPAGLPEAHYFTFTYQAYREQGTIVGVSIFGHEVNAPTQAR
jgi:PAS domain S-box-containing protein